MSKKSRSKKAGFTLIEVVAGLAIISILSIIFAPKVGKFIGKANKTKALDEVRQVVLAVEDYSIESGNKVDENENFASIKKKLNGIEKDKKVIDVKTIKSIDENMKYSTMLELINGKKNFILKDGKIQITT